MNRLSGVPIAGLAALAIALCGCSAAGGKTPRQEAAPAAAIPAAAPSQAPAGPEATIEISYARQGDTLRSLTVLQFTGATLLIIEKGPGGRSTSLVRFDGGAPIWEIQSGRGVLNLLGGGKEYAVRKIKYGKLPPGFVQNMPEEGPPAPLEPGGYYIFKIVRASGATNYEAIRLGTDGTIQGYGAEARAGTSYSLCCNVPDSFIAPTSSSESSPDQFTPDDTIPDQGIPDQDQP